MYELPQDGQLDYIAIIRHLQLHGYTHAGLTTVPFKLSTRDTLLSLVVDEIWGEIYIQK